MNGKFDTGFIKVISCRISDNLSGKLHSKLIDFIASAHMHTRITLDMNQAINYCAFLNSDFQKDGSAGTVRKLF